ncbi:MAG: hypothetical protein NUV50_00975 [Rhodospirillales bacterium]|nr:hypothetical protein [Rhodospirillales bacterium]
MDILIAFGSVFVVLIGVVVGNHFGGSIIESRLQRMAGNNQVISVAPGRNAKPAPDLLQNTKTI